MKKNDAEVHKIPLFDVKGKKADTIELKKEIFNGKFSEGLLYHAVKMYRANMRKGTASTKTRAAVRGGGKKPWKQKGTGRARVASIRNPIWRGGGIAFGPHPRSFRYDLPKRAKSGAFIASLNAKLKAGEVIALEDMPTADAKTKRVSGLLKKLNLKGSILVIVDKIDKNLALASRNIKGLTLKTSGEATALNVLEHDRVIMTKNAVQALNKKFTQ